MNFTMYSGNTKKLYITVYDKPNGSVVSLTGATAIKWQLFYTTPATGDPLITKSLASGITVTSAAGGIFRVTLAASDTTSLSGKYYYEAEVTDASAEIQTVLTGFVMITHKRIT